MNITNTELDAYITTLRSDLRKARGATTNAIVKHPSKGLKDAENYLYHALRVLDMITEQMEYNEEWD